MKKPSLPAYGLNEAALLWAKEIENEIMKTTRWVAIFFAPIGLAIKENVIFLIYGWLFFWLVLWAFFYFRLRLNPLYRNVRRYRADLVTFERWWVRTQEAFWGSLSGLQFEHELAALFVRSGLNAKVTPPSGDGGVDIWIDTPEGKKIVQCKAHRIPIGPGVARELHGTMVHFGANGAILASTSGFTRGVRDFVRGKPIQLMGLSEIIAMQKALAK